jgi:hypothetical protein
MLGVTATDPPPANSSKLPNLKKKKKLDRVGIVDNRPSTDSQKNRKKRKKCVIAGQNKRYTL